MRDMMYYFLGYGDGVRSALEPVDNGALRMGSMIYYSMGFSDGARSVAVAVDKAPYNFRASGGGLSLRGMEMDKLVGGTVCWNQMLDPDLILSSITVKGVTTTRNGNDVIFSGTATDDDGFSFIAENNHPELIGHKVYMCGAKSGVRIRLRQSPVEYDTGNGLISTVQAVDALRLVASIKKGDVYNNVRVSPQVFDLTQMLGSTIADYIYSLEQATAGSGVAWFRRLFPKDYYAYNAGELMSVNAAAHVMRDASENIIGNYPLDHSLTLRGIPKLDANNALYYDGDAYESDGTVTRKYGIVDLGTLEWTYQSAYTRFYCNPANMKPITSQYIVPVNYMMPIYRPLRSYDFGNLGTDKAYCLFEDGRLLIRDTSYSDAETFKAAMSGVCFVYELATPTTEAAEPFQNPQIVDAAGTEAYVDYAESHGARDVAIPVGHETKYTISAT